MPTLIVASRTAAYDAALARCAADLNWPVVECDGNTLPSAVADPVLYVTTDVALAASRRLNLALLEPPLDLLARVPEKFRRRAVEFATFADLTRLRKPTFVKPADPLDKWFDPGVYSDVRDIRTKNRVSPDAPVLLSEPVEWTAEFRCFVLDGKVAAASPYLRFGRPAWKAGSAAATPPAARALAEEVCRAASVPPGFVVDVGVIEDRGWAVVEFNPAWSAGLLAADPRGVLDVLRRVSQPADELSADDARWVVARP